MGMKEYLEYSPFEQIRKKMRKFYYMLIEDLIEFLKQWGLE